MKYKVLKECLSVKQPRWLEPGSIFDGTPNSPRIKALLNRGYIEPVPEELKVTLSGQYIPATGQRFWGIMFDSLFGVVAKGIDRKYAQACAEVGLAFRRKVEFQEWIDKQKAYQILRQDAKGFRPDWKNPPQRKWSASYNHAYGELNAVWDDEDQQVGALWFASEEDLRVSFKKHRKEWLTVFGVEEGK